MGLGLVLERLLWYFSDTSVVTDDAGKWRQLQGLPLGPGEDSLLLPPKSEIESLKKIILA